MSEEDNIGENDEDTDSFNRRSFVKALGAAGGTAMVGTLSAGQGAAKVAGTRQATQEQVNHALRSAEVQTVLSELGDPAVQRGKADYYQVDLDKRMADESIELTTLPTPIGAINVC